MSGIDRTIYNTREQLLSTDLNSAQALAARVLLDALRWTAASSQEIDDNDAVRFEQALSVVLGGLEVEGAASGASVSPGMVLQPYPGVGTAPGALDSPYVLGRLVTTTIAPVPVPGVDTWYLIQARVNEAASTTSRLVWDPIFEVFNPTVITTQIDQTIEFNAKVGTATQLPIPDAGFVPIAGMRRLASGAASASSDIIDLRPLANDNSQRVPPDTELLLETMIRPNTYDIVAGIVTSWNFRIVAEVGEGGRLFARNDAATGLTDLTLPAFLDPTNPLATGWHYLCLFAGFDLSPNAIKPRSAYNNVRSQGVLVLSHLPPSTIQGSRAPSNTTIVLPAPFGNLSTAMRAGVCVGMFYRDGPAWLTSTVFNGTWRVGNRSLMPLFPAAGITIPVNARAVTLMVASTTVSDAFYVKNGAQIIAVGNLGAANAPVEMQVPLIGLTTAQVAALTYTTLVATPLFAYLVAVEF